MAAGSALGRADGQPVFEFVFGDGSGKRERVCGAEFGDVHCEHFPGVFDDSGDCHSKLRKYVGDGDSDDQSTRP